MALSKYIRAQNDVQWFFAEGSLLFDLRGIDYDKVRVQSSATGDITNDRRHKAYKRYRRVYERLMAMPSWARLVLAKRYEPVSHDAISKEWQAYGEWSNLITSFAIKGEDSGAKIKRAKELVREAMGLYVEVRV